MMKRVLLSLSTLMMVANIAMAAELPDNAALKDERMQVVKRYIMDLQNADSADIIKLFEANAKAISTSRGEVDAQTFFASFLPMIDSAETQFKQIFINEDHTNRLAARFHFSFQLKDGEEGEGEYVDEFIFSYNSSKLSSVYMFENLKFPPHSQGD